MGGVSASADVLSAEPANPACFALRRALPGNSGPGLEAAQDTWKQGLRQWRRRLARLVWQSFGSGLWLRAETKRDAIARQHEIIIYARQP